MLIATRLELLDRTSNQKGFSRCFRRLVWLQAVGVMMLICFSMWFFLETVGFTDQSKASEAVLLKIEPHPWSMRQRWMFLCIAVLVIFVWLCNVAASTVAVRGLYQCFSQLTRILRQAKSTSTAAWSSLRRARRLAALQVVGVSVSLVSTSLLLPAAFYTSGGLLLLYDDSGDDGIWWDECLLWVTSLVQFVDSSGNAVAVLLLSGSHRLWSEDSQPSQSSQRMSCCECPTRPKAASATEPTWSPAWKAKVQELSLRGMTLRSLLRFYQQDLPSMPDWRYSPKEHKTRDVVRRSIVPLTSGEESAYAASSLNRDGARRAQVMVTHNWGNCFKDLLAAVISDALQESSFNLAANLLEEDCAFLCEILAKSGRLDDTYWICAFAVNQHISICHTNPYDRDPFTNELHPVCSCSSVNISDLDGRSTSSEINKFDNMMYHLKATGGCRQIVAVDQSIGLFNRAWCVAEIAEAKRLQMTQSLQLASRATIMQRARTLENLDVRCMRASSKADKELILKKIESITNIDQFNKELRSLILDPKSGLLASWHAVDSLQQIGEAGRLVRWGLADAGTGKVWRAWGHDE